MSTPLCHVDVDTGTGTRRDEGSPGPRTSHGSRDGRGWPSDQNRGSLKVQVEKEEGKNVMGGVRTPVKVATGDYQIFRPLKRYIRRSTSKVHLI